MKTSLCACSNRLFFNNHQCIACGRLVGRCDHCHQLTSVTQVDEGEYQCDQVHCKRKVVACQNRGRWACNSFVVADTPGICRWCELTTILPDLGDPKNVARWCALEAAKRRLLVALEQLGLPPYVGDLSKHLPLTFQFLAPLPQPDGSVTPVMTGHAEGVITINVEEADSDRREATRVALGEPHRTLIGHMRHEVGHYIDWSFAWRVDPDGYRELFGDPMAQDYEAAKQRHYSQGAPSDWPMHYVSAYASMHPWEDFAETVNAYLDMMAIAETGNDQQLATLSTAPEVDMRTIVAEVLKLAIAISEFNSDLGLQLLLPEQLPEPTIAKLEYVHRLRLPAMRQRLITTLSGGATVARPKVPQPTSLAGSRN